MVRSGPYLVAAVQFVCVGEGPAPSLKILTVTLYSFSNTRAVLLPNFLSVVLTMLSARELRVLMPAFY